jgi:hypothetical protein
MFDGQQQVVTGVVPPELGEAKIREMYPSVAASPAIAGVGQALTRTIVLAPLAWMIMALAYFGKLLPFAARRYTLTNRRLMVRRGWKGTPAQQAALADIDEVRVKTDVNSRFFRSGTLEIVSKGQVVMTLPGTPEPDSFRHAILNACAAWVPGKAKELFPFIAASATK